MNFSITDNRGEDRSHFTRPIQGPYKNILKTEFVEEKKDNVERVQNQPRQQFEITEIKTTVLEPVSQFQKQELLEPKIESKPFERRPKPLQLQRSRFQPRRREMSSRVSEEQPQPQTQPQPQPHSQTHSQTQPRTPYHLQSQTEQQSQNQDETQYQHQSQPSSTDIFGLSENKQDNEFGYSIDDE